MPLGETRAAVFFLYVGANHPLEQVDCLSYSRMKSLKLRVVPCNKLVLPTCIHIPRSRRNLTNGREKGALKR